MTEYQKEKKEEKLKDEKEFIEYQNTKEVENLINSDYDKFLSMIEGMEDK